MKSTKEIKILYTAFYSALVQLIIWIKSLIHQSNQDSNQTLDTVKYAKKKGTYQALSKSMIHCSNIAFLLNILLMLTVMIATVG